MSSTVHAPRVEAVPLAQVGRVDEEDDLIADPRLVDILYEPDAVGVVGPQARAQRVDSTNPIRESAPVEPRRDRPSTVLGAPADRPGSRRDDAGSGAAVDDERGEGELVGADAVSRLEKSSRVFPEAHRRHGPLDLGRETFAVCQDRPPERGDRRIRVDKPRFVDGTAFHQAEGGTGATGERFDPDLDRHVAYLSGEHVAEHRRDGRLPSGIAQRAQVPFHAAMNHERHIPRAMPGWSRRPLTTVCRAYHR